MYDCLNASCPTLSLFRRKSEFASQRYKCNVNILGLVHTERNRQCSNDASDTAVTEINVVILKWDAERLY